jgi:glycerol transport system permease protein
VALNTIISLTVALPAAYAFSRYRFLGDKHLFFWLLTNRMAPPAVFALPFLQLYTAVGLIDTHIAVALAHTAVQRAAGRVDSGRLHERYASRNRRDRLRRRLFSFPRFFLTLFLPTDHSGRGRGGVLLLHVQLGGAPAGAHADECECEAHCGHHDPNSIGLWHGLGHVGRRRRPDHRTGAIVIWFVRNYIAKGFAMGRV